MDILDQRVGPSGTVVGLDREPTMLEWARASLNARGLAHVRLVEGTGQATGLPSSNFDVVHGRLVLVHTSQPADIVAEMVRLARPGGSVCVQDVDCMSWLCEPEHPAWSELVSLLSRITSIDLLVGRKLPALLRQAGLEEVGCDAHAYVWDHTHPYQTLLIDLVGIVREHLMSLGMITAERLDRLTEELAEHLDHPDTFVIHPLLMQAWGRKPSEPGEAGTGP
ncbi:methyltransferase domain-containing protein [Phytoactinopolyspora halophila]|uniref:methyltransferase domain-containing protein n=1 Tax=Phytoactinopolyspora halophila TaxID=1981511 RepID=UPI001313FE7D|nr:methyltransferase domain-containing protein [Phytoactinopolyspora halophila]